MKYATSYAFQVLEEGGYLTCQGYDHRPLRTTIPPVSYLVAQFAQRDFPVYFTRESHRPDLSTLSPREHFRSRNNSSGIGIGSTTPRLGRALIRGELGCSIIQELSSFAHDTGVVSNTIDKPGRSAFAHTELELILRNKGIKNLILCGVTTDVCVHSTMREANDRGFDCLLVEDASAAGTDELHRWAVESIKGEGGIFGAVSMVQEITNSLLLDEQDSATGWRRGSCGGFVQSLGEL